MTNIEPFDARDLLATATADVLAAALTGGVGGKTFAATGGTTPGPVYDVLAGRDLDWANVTVTLTDDRWVDPSSPLSNEAQVRASLLVGKAAAARFVPLKGVGPTPRADALAAEPAIAALSPFDAVLLGMGSDGHVASLFPGCPNLTSKALCVGVEVAGLEPYVPRVSLTARALLDSRLIVVLVTGEQKRALIEGILRGEATDRPVSAILRQSVTPVRVLWAR